MTSGQFDYIDPHEIVVERDERQRKTIEDVSDLADSIRKIGLIHPPIIERESLRLVSGERRLTALKEIGMAPIPVQYSDTVEPIILHLIELEENIKRKNLTWQEEADAIQRYHAMKQKMEGEDWTFVQTAADLSMSDRNVARYVEVAEHLDDDMVQTAEKFSTAVNIVARKKERKMVSDKQELDDNISKVLNIPQQEEPVELDEDAPAGRFAEIINADFTEWAQSYSGPKFNFLHCDFPYGVNVGDKVGQSRAKETGMYSDRPEDFFVLINTILLYGDNFLAESAHCMFWFSMNFYSKTKATFENAGWTVLPHPLIWHKSDGKGMMPDPNRQPRRTYETALMMSRGDRKIVRATNNSVAAVVTNEHHTSEKPRAVLDHFFKMFIDDSSLVLDPTCGSGNAICEAYLRGAQKSLGIELDKEFATGAAMNLLRVKEQAK